MTVRTFRDGRLVAQATDRGVGCAPIKGPTHLGIRADNADASFRRYRVHELSPLPATSCPDSLVGPARDVALLAERSRARARVHAGRCPAAFLPTGP